ncbi:MAG: filamentous hemagglutinin N-terminal domain-containing protein, partial [Leptolyngbya sp. Prado105]|nr:filamentous hemagglutinin N-terminal domain-containing protein [Leptolyngbya sp. Prado105]
MKRKLLGFGLLGLSSFLCVERVQAQAVISDGTVNTIVTRAGNVFTIDNGTTSGTNLFHSFQEFSIPTGGAAIFNN